MKYKTPTIYTSEKWAARVAQMIGVGMLANGLVEGDSSLTDIGAAILGGGYILHDVAQEHVEDGRTTWLAEQLGGAGRRS